MKLPIRHCLAVLGWMLGSALAVAADFTLIAHPSVPDALSHDDVKNILLGNKTKWDDGRVIKLAVLSEGAANEAVVQSFTTRSADQFDKYWKKQVFTGKGVAPDAFKTDAEMIAFVAKTPGSFGYISAGAKPDGVKTLVVQ